MSRTIVCTSLGNRYQWWFSLSSCGGLFQEKKHSTYKHHLMCNRWRQSMVGHHFGFLSYSKKAVPEVPTVHCVINRQHLVANNLSEKLHEFLSTVITAVNKIKANGLNPRLFHQLCVENCLKRFHILFNSVLYFFKNPKVSFMTNWNRVRKILLTELICFQNSMKWIKCWRVMRFHYSYSFLACLTWRRKQEWRKMTLPCTAPI